MVKSDGKRFTIARFAQFSASGVVLAAGMCSAANATSFGFAFVSGSSLSAFGRLTTGSVLNAKGGYDVNGITGFANALAITSLIANPTQPVTSTYTLPGGGGAYFTYDNTLYASDPHVDIDGILFKVGVRTYEIYNDGSQDVLSYFDGGTSSFVNVFGTFAVSPTPLTSSVPAPAAWVMMTAGFGLIGAAMRRRSSITVDFA